jgi:hypothetical protein
MYNDSGHELETHIYILIKMMSVKTHGGKTIRSEVTQHTQKNFTKKLFFPVKAKKIHFLGSRPYTLKKL